MKLRIRGNSIRLRLTKSEIETLATKGTILEAVPFSPQNFFYTVEKSLVPNLSASFDNGKISVFIPIELADQWVNSGQVGLEGSDGELRILIEKDFVCLNPRRDDDDEDDHFPHPKHDKTC